MFVYIEIVLRIGSTQDRAAESMPKRDSCRHHVAAPQWTSLTCSHDTPHLSSAPIANKDTHSDNIRGTGYEGHHAKDKTQIPAGSFHGSGDAISGMLQSHQSDSPDGTQQCLVHNTTGFLPHSFTEEMNNNNNNSTLQGSIQLPKLDCQGEVFSNDI